MSFKRTKGPRELTEFDSGQIVRSFFSKSFLARVKNGESDRFIDRLVLKGSDSQGWGRQPAQLKCISQQIDVEDFIIIETFVDQMIIPSE